MNPFLYVNDPAKVHVQLSDNSNPSLVFQSFEFTLAVIIYVFNITSKMILR